MLVISPAATAKIVEEAQRAYPHEGCGMLVGVKGGRAVSVRGVREFLGHGHG